MSIRTTTAFAAGAVVALVLGTGTAYAANGGSFKLGGNNYETREASLNNSNGTALTLRSKSGTPSLKVNRTTKVPNLNSDRVDGLSSGQIARKVAPGTATGTGEIVEGPDDTSTDDDFIMAFAVCPEGSYAMGGGVADATDDGLILASRPDLDDAWFGVTSATATQQNADSFTVFARCWNPVANVQDTSARQAPRELSPSVKRQLARMAHTR
jgi:hypothetical protein